MCCPAPRHRRTTCASHRSRSTTGMRCTRGRHLMFTLFDREFVRSKHRSTSWPKSSTHAHGHQQQSPPKPGLPRTNKFKILSDCLCAASEGTPNQLWRLRNRLCRSGCCTYSTRSTKPSNSLSPSQTVGKIGKNRTEGAA